MVGGPIMEFKGAVLHAINEPLRIEDITLPKLEEGQVLVQMKASGL